MSAQRPRRDVLDASPSQGTDEDVWLMTYLDVFTLLLVMMVVLLAFAQPTPKEGAAPQEKPPAGFLQTLTEELRRSGNPWDELPLKELGPNVEVLLEGGVVRFRLDAEVLFDPGQAQLMGSGLDVLDRLAPLFQKVKGHQVSVEGHTDTTPIQTERFPSNWELSSARASAVVRYLVARGVAPENLRAAGLAGTRPLSSNETPEGRALNRRVELVLEPKAR